MQIQATERFKKNYSRFSPVGQQAVRNRIIQILKFHNDLGGEFQRNFESIKVELKNTYRDKASKGDRMLFIYDGNLTLLDVGSHDVYRDWEKRKLSATKQREIFETRSPIPKDWVERILPESNVEQIFDEQLGELSLGSALAWNYDEELELDRWLYFLDENQLAVKEELFHRLVSSKGFDLHVLTGAAGTGKTVVLSELAKDLYEAGLKVKLLVNQGVAKQLKAAGFNAQILTTDASELTTYWSSYLLVDDPMNMKIVQEIHKRAGNGIVKGLVLAVDPLQWKERKALDQFGKFLDGKEITVLTQCYRQSKKSGQQALQMTKKVLEKTSPYIDPQKVADHKAKMSFYIRHFVDELSFPHPGGIAQVLDGTDSLLKAEGSIERYMSRYDKWATKSVLLVWDRTFTAKKQLKAMFSGAGSEDVWFEDVDKVRGVEFQEVFVFLSQEKWESLNKIQYGAGAWDWESKTPLHTYLTRAKDAWTIVAEPKSQSSVANRTIVV